MKKITALLLAALLMLAGLTACGGDQSDDTADGSGSGVSVVTTIFPVYDWAQNVAGADNSNVDIDMLINSGVDLHSYQPTAEDMMKISECDVFIYVGGESDEWAMDALEGSNNPDRVVVNLMEAMGDKAVEEEVREGMEAEHEEGEEEDEEEGPEYDEHIWLSLRNASLLSGVISDALAKVDPENADSYKANAESYEAQLNELDGEYQKAVSEGRTKTLLFGDRFPFRYMTDDYGLDYYAAFVGCSAETEASFETIAFLASKVDELGLRSVMTIEGKDHSIAESIVSNTKTKDQQILTLDSMQGTTAQDVENGATYISVMKSNLETLREALK